MDDLQYDKKIVENFIKENLSFKPYYKWMTFNTNYEFTEGDIDPMNFKF